MAKSKTVDAKRADIFRSRIVPGSLSSKPADQFTIHPLNAKYHPEFQSRALKGALDEIGYVAPVIESLRTGYLLDGHDRVWISMERNNSDVPFIVVDVTEQEEAYILATLDPLGWLSSHSREKMSDLLQIVQTQSEGVSMLLDGLSIQGGAGSALLDIINSRSEPPTIDALSEKYGDLEPEAFYPIITVKVAPSTLELYSQLMSKAVGDTEADKFLSLMQAVDPDTL